MNLIPKNSQFWDTKTIKINENNFQNNIITLKHFNNNNNNNNNNLINNLDLLIINNININNQLIIWSKDIHNPLKCQKSQIILLNSMIFSVILSECSNDSIYLLKMEVLNGNIIKNESFFGNLKNIFEIKNTNELINNEIIIEEIERIDNNYVLLVSIHSFIHSNDLFVCVCLNVCLFVFRCFVFDC